MQVGENEGQPRRQSLCRAGTSSVARMPIKTLVKGGRVEAALQHTIKRCPFIHENQSLLQAKGKPPVFGKSRKTCLAPQIACS